MNVYLTDKEVQCLIAVCGQWGEMLEGADEDLTTDMYENGLGSALYKLSKGRRLQEIYKKYAKKKGGAE